MAKHRLATAALAVVALHVMPVLAPVVHAQGAEDDEARAAFYQGRSLYKSGEYAKAAEMLQRAYELKPHPALQRYLGMTYYKMNKPHDAIKAFKRYLAEAPSAPDRDKILARVRELEMVVGASDDEETHPAPAAPAAPTPTPAPTPATPAAAPSPAAPVSPSMVPTGDDDEMPDELGSGARREGRDGSSSSLLSVLKWVSLGVGVGGLAAGAVFSGLAAGKASDLEQSVIDSGNPTKTTPKVAYGREHHDLQEAFKRNRTAGIICWVVGGVASAAAATFFLLDRGGGSERAGRRVQIAPVIGEVYGVAGQVQF